MKVVLCEGPSDQAILAALIKRSNLDITVESYGGKDRLKKHLAWVKARSHDPKYPKRPTYHEITTLAVTRDANGDREGAFTSVRATLANMDFVNLPAPNNEFSGEAPGTRESKRTGIFIVGHEGTGVIEDLCIASLRERDRPKFSCVGNYFACIEQAEPKTKARAWVWMASDPKFDFSAHSVMGEGEGYWDLDHPAFRPLKQFLMAM